jgi:hypothetical protein
MTPRHRRIKSFIMKGGERYCLLVDSATGLPFVLSESIFNPPS